MNSDHAEKKEALHSLRSMLRKGSAHAGVPQYHDRDETDHEDASVAQLVMPDHDVGDVKDQNEAHNTPSPQATMHKSASGLAGQYEPVPENVKPGSGSPGEGWREGDKGRGASEVRARDDGMTRSPGPRGPNPPGKQSMSSPSEQTKPGNSGPGWAEGDRGRGPSELRARADASHRTALGEAGDESEDKDLVAGLIHVAKKYRAP